MGPSIYDEVEALKAQAVAARTYAIRNLRPVRERGLRHLSRPRVSGVQRLRRRARAVHARGARDGGPHRSRTNGKPIDALYSATCGGETSDVAHDVPRPQRAVSEAREVRGAGDAHARRPRRQRSAHRACRSTRGSSPRWRICRRRTSWSARDVARAVVAAMTLAGDREHAISRCPRPRAARRRARVPRRDDGPRREGARAHAARGSRSTSSRRAANAEDVPYLAAAFLIKYGI